MLSITDIVDAAIALRDAIAERRDEAASKYEESRPRSWTRNPYDREGSDYWRQQRDALAAALSAADALFDAACVLDDLLNPAPPIDDSVAAIAARIMALGAEMRGAK